MSRPALSPFRHPPRLSLVQGRDLHHVALKPGLDRPALQRAVDIFGSPVIAVDGQEFGLGLAAEDARARTAVGARQGSAADGAIDVNGSARDDLGAGSDRS